MKQRPRDSAPSGWSEDDFGPAETGPAEARPSGPQTMMPWAADPGLESEPVVPVPIDPDFKPFAPRRPERGAAAAGPAAPAAEPEFDWERELQKAPPPKPELTAPAVAEAVEPAFDWARELGKPMLPRYGSVFADQGSAVEVRPVSDLEPGSDPAPRSYPRTYGNAAPETPRIAEPFPAVQVPVPLPAETERPEEVRFDWAAEFKPFAALEAEPEEVPAAPAAIEDSAVSTIADASETPDSDEGPEPEFDWASELEAVMPRKFDSTRFDQEHRPRPSADPTPISPPSVPAEVEEPVAAQALPEVEFEAAEAEISADPATPVPTPMPTSVSAPPPTESGLFGPVEISSLRAYPRFPEPDAVAAVQPDTPALPPLPVPDPAHGKSFVPKSPARVAVAVDPPVLDLPEPAPAAFASDPFVPQPVDRAWPDPAPSEPQWPDPGRPDRIEADFWSSNPGQPAVWRSEFDAAEARGPFEPKLSRPKAARPKLFEAGPDSAPWAAAPPAQPQPQPQPQFQPEFEPQPDFEPQPQSQRYPEPPPRRHPEPPPPTEVHSDAGWLETVHWQEEFDPDDGSESPEHGRKPGPFRRRKGRAA